MVAEGADPSALDAERWIDARYKGQSFELAVPADGWVAHFHRAHLERYGYERPAAAVEAVTLRVVVGLPANELAVEPLVEAQGRPATQSARVVFGGRPLDTVRVWRRDLRAGHRLAGPCVVQEYSGTTWVPPEWTLSVDPTGCLHLTPDA
jgi:N-methylhydantoinase A